VSTLDQGHPTLLPIQWSAYHRDALAGTSLNSSVTLTRQVDGWWLSVSYEEDVPDRTPQNAPVVGIDVGITHFLTTSTGKHDGTFRGKLSERQQRDREQRRRKAKLRACLK
jgi:transposase